MILIDLTNYELPIKEKKISQRLILKFFQYRTSVVRSKLNKKLNNLNELKKIVHWNIQHNAFHLEYMIYSLKLIINETPLMTSVAEENIFYDNLKLYFIFLKEQNINSYTFKEYLCNQENL